MQRSLKGQKKKNTTFKGGRLKKGSTVLVHIFINSKKMFLVVCLKLFMLLQHIF